LSYTDYVQRGTNPTQVTTANGAQPLLPEDLQKSIISGAVEQSAILRFATKRRLARGVQRQAVLESLPVAYFINGETGLKQTTAMTWRNVFINVEELACIVPIPEALLADVDYDLWEEFQPKVEEAFGVAIDAAVLFGTGAPASWPTAVATAAIAAGNTATTGGGIDIGADLNNVQAALEADGYDNLGWVHRQDLRAAVRGLRNLDNDFIFKPAHPGLENTAFGSGPNARNGNIMNVPARSLLNGVFEAENVASANAVRAIAGDWSQLVAGIRMDLTMKRFDTGVIQNASGDITFNLLQQDLVAARFVMRLGYAVPNPINRTNQTTSTRYPFSVLRDAA
jgi:HK97 family phage major capsid protein